MNDRTYQKLEDELQYIRFGSVKQIKQKIESILNGTNIELRYKNTHTMFGDSRLVIKVEGEAEKLFIDYIRDNEDRLFVTMFM